MGPSPRLCGPSRSSPRRGESRVHGGGRLLPQRSFGRSLGRAASRPPAAPRALPLGSSDADSAWSRVALLRRQLGLAVSEEDYAAAARLRDEVATAEAALPPQKRMLLGLLERLEAAPTLRERLTAVQALGDLGDAAALPALQASLTAGELGDVAEASMWAIFVRPGSDAVRRLMDEGVAAMAREATYPQAIQAFDRAIAADPGYAEAHNKRATTFYLMRRYRDAIADCEMTLELNPYHFGAASGMGMCWSALEGWPQAKSAFQRALDLNPRMEHLRHHVFQLQQLIDDEERRAREREREREG